jgi:hypothetical protein
VTCYKRISVLDSSIGASFSLIFYRFIVLRPLLCWQICLSVSISPAAVVCSLFVSSSVSVILLSTSLGSVVMAISHSFVFLFQCCRAVS